MGFYFVTVVLFALMGAGSFWFIYSRPWFAAIGFVLGAWVGSETAYNKLARLKFPDVFYEYSSEVKTIEKETCILALTIEDVTKNIRGLSVDEWKNLAAKVIDIEYQFTSRSGLGDLYDRTKGKLLNAGVLSENSKGGFDVTDNGMRFFTQLQKGDYKILETLPSLQHEND